MNDRDIQDNRFTAGLAPLEGVSGFGLKQSLDLAFELILGEEGKDPGMKSKELVGFVLDDMAETVYVQWVYAALHGQWQPTTDSGQEGNWKEKRAFLKSLIKIKGKYEDEE